MKSLREAREHYEMVRRTAEAEVRAEVSKRVEGARYEMARTAHALRASGMNIAKLAQDYGTKDRGTIYRLLDSYSFAAETIAEEVTEITNSGIDPRAFITVERLENGWVTITGTDVPSTFWTFTEGMTTHPSDLWSGEQHIDAVNNMPVGRSTPLWVEWRKGTGLDYVKEEAK